MVQSRAEANQKCIFRGIGYGGGHHDVSVARQVDFPTKSVPVVLGDAGQAFVYASTPRLGGGGVEIGTAHQRGALGVKARYEQVGTVGKGVSVGGNRRSTAEGGLCRTGRDGKVGRTSDAKNNQLVPRHNHGMGLVRTSAAEVGGINALRAVCVELGDAGVDAVVASRGKSWIKDPWGGGVAWVEHNTSAVQVALIVVGSGKSPIVGS